MLAFSQLCKLKATWKPHYSWHGNENGVKSLDFFTSFQKKNMTTFWQMEQSFW